MNRLRVAVLGTGHLGRIHARLLNELDEVELVGVVDPSKEARERVAAECKTRPLEDIDELSGQVDAAVVATPTHCHHDVADRLLRQNVHVLIEKPITTTVAEADRLIALAREQDCVLQVGHVERFNPAWDAVVSKVENPRYIEAVRAGPYPFRSTDVSIVLDLMIHDIDLVLSLVDSPVIEVEALGAALLGPKEDLAHARLKFQNGCIVNLNASRVSYEPQRTMQLFSPRAFAAIDFATGHARVVQPNDEVLRQEVDLTDCPPDQRQGIQDSMFDDLLCMNSLTVERVNAILEEQRDFVTAIQDGREVRVTGEQARDALAVAEQILQSIRTHRWNGQLPGPIGPQFRTEPIILHPKRAA